MERNFILIILKHVQSNLDVEKYIIYISIATLSINQKLIDK